MKIYWYNGSKNIIDPAVLKLRLDSAMTQKEVAEQMQLRGVESSGLPFCTLKKDFVLLLITKSVLWQMFSF